MVKTVRSRVLHLEVLLQSMLSWCFSIWSRSHRAGNPYSLRKAYIWSACCLWLVVFLDIYSCCCVKIKKKICLEVKQAWTIATKPAVQGLEGTSEPRVLGIGNYGSIWSGHSHSFLSTQVCKPVAFTCITFTLKSLRASLLWWLESIF